MNSNIKEKSTWTNTKSYKNLYYCYYCGDGLYTMKETENINKCPNCGREISHK